MIQISALSTDVVRAYQSGAPDAYSQKPERAVSDGQGNPCRHCLQEIPKGAGMLVLAYRPFDGLHPYAETGPMFLCELACGRYTGTSGLPPALATSPSFLIKGYSSRDRIVYGTGQVIRTSDMAEHAEHIFADANVDYIHIRSACNNCYQARIDRGAKLKV